MRKLTLFILGIFDNEKRNKASNEKNQLSLGMLSIDFPIWKGTIKKTNPILVRDEY